MRLEDVATKTVDGVKWYMAQDLTLVFHLPNTHVIGKTLNLYPQHKRMLTVGRDYQMRKRCLFVDLHGLLILATRYGETPLQELTRRLSYEKVGQAQ